MPTPYPWLGAGAVSLGIGAAAFAGSASAHADDTRSDSAAAPSKTNDLDSSGGPASSTTATPAADTGPDDSSHDRNTRGTADKPRTKTDDERGEVTKISPKRRAFAANPARSTRDADEARRDADPSAPAPNITERRVSPSNAASTTASSVDSKNPDTSAATTKLQPAAGVEAKAAGSTTPESRVSPAVEAETQATQQLADNAAPTTRNWLLRTLFNQTPKVSFVPDRNTTLPNGTIKGVIKADDADGDVLTYTASKPVNGGSVTIDGEGAFTYTPGPGFASAGADTFTVTVSDQTAVNGWRIHGLMGLLFRGWGATATTTVSVARRPSTVTPPPTVAPPTSPSSPATAADRYGWGTPSQTTTFTGPSALSNGWRVYNSAGHAGYGRRTPAAISFADNAMVLTGDAAGNTAGLAWMPAQKYGAWEVRVRVPQGAADYHAVALLWPEARNWPVGGEMDFLELINDASRQRVGHFLHYSSQNLTESATTRVDATQWHNYAVSWTPQKITYYIDGAPVFSTTDTSHFPPGPMFLALQLDAAEKRPINLAGGAQMMVQWARQYTLSQIT